MAAAFPARAASTATVVNDDPAAVDSVLGAETTSYASKIAQTISGYTVDSDIGPIDTPIPLEIADFILDHPDMAAYLVDRHKLGTYHINMRAPRQSWADDGQGTKGLVTLTQRGANRRVYLAEGYHDGSFFPRIHGAAVIILNVQELAKPGCPPGIRTTFKIYVKLRSTVLSGLIKAVRPFRRGRGFYPPSCLAIRLDPAQLQTLRTPC